MDRPTFFTWLTRELNTSKMALLGLYEKRDHILYVEAPPLRKKYMDLIGVTEEAVLQAELEVYILQRKIEMIQAAINRREKVDLEAINKELEKERQQKISETEQADLTLNELPQLTEQEKKTIQRQYREITNKFHPAVNPDISETEKELYEKAVEAYKLQDVEAMDLIYDLLFEPDENVRLNIAFEMREPTREEKRADYHNTAQKLSIDYRLAKKLYSFFRPLESDKIVMDTLQHYENERRSVEEEIDKIRSGFPFNAETTINDSAKTQEYLAELRIREKNAAAEKAELEQKIAQMTEDQAGG